jgi:putative heme transporter
MKTSTTPRRSTGRMLTAGLIGVAAVTLLVVLPRTVGTTWATVSRILGQIPPAGLVVLTLVWIAGLWSHSFVLAASLPGLTRRRGLALNLTGSAVANVLPLGGAAGTGLNFAMTRRWGFSSGSFAAFLTVSTLANTVARLLVVVVALALAPVVHTSAALPLVRTGTLLIPVLAVLAAVVWILASERAATHCGHTIDVVVGGVARLVGSSRRPALTTSLAALRRAMLRVLRAGWRPMSAGMVGYLLLQAALLWLCFYVLGSPLSLQALLTGLAVERLLTLVPITPGGAGVVEIGTVAALVALGGAPAVVAAGFLLYRGFTYLLEIPVGGTTLAFWLLRNRRLGPKGVAA